MSRHASLNRAYRLVWDAARNLWIPVAETARGRGKSGRVLTLTATLAVAASSAWALPTGGVVTAGGGGIAQSGASMTITQQTAKLAIDWQGFNIGAGENVTFAQPTATAIALNRVTTQNPTQILGSLNANGQVFVLNPSGVLFGQGAQVSVGGLAASTLNLSNADFLAGQFAFKGNGGAVENRGAITAAPGGYVALLGSRVVNEGEITATRGNVSLAAGNAVTLQLDNGSLAGVTVDRGSLDALAANKGLIRADGGQVLLTAQAADTLAKAAVNNEGVIEAQTLENRGGVIRLLGDMAVGEVNAGGTLDASAPDGGNGGFIETSAAKVRVAHDLTVTTHAAQGKTGEWLIDPNDFLLAASGGDMTGIDLSKQLDQTSVTISNSQGATAGNGDILINDPVSWGADTVLTLNADRHVGINAAMTAGGKAAGLSINPGAGGVFSVGAGGSVSLTGINATLGIAGNNYTLLHSVTDLQGMRYTGYYALAESFSAASATAFNPIGNTDVSFSGVFEGLGNTISGLTINRPTSSHVGLFAISTGVIRDVNLSKVSISGYSILGGLAAENGGLIENSTVDGQVASSTNGAITNLNDVGGLVGLNTANGKIVGSSSSAAVLAQGLVSLSQYANVGGLVGDNEGSISNSSATGTVTASLLDGGSVSAIGGLVGLNNGTIDETGLTAATTGGQVVITAASVNGNAATLSDIGGLVGINNNALDFASTGGYSGGGVSVTDSSTGGSILRVGGATGENAGTLTHAVNSGTVSAIGGSIQDIGGLTGDNTGTVTGGSSSGAVQVQSANSYVSDVGGVAGQNQLAISGVADTAAVTVTGNQSYLSDIGGVVGFNNGTLANTMGGGSGGPGATLTDSLAQGALTVTAQNGGVYAVGGIAGYNSGAIDESAASSVTQGAVNASATSSRGAVTVYYVGGAIGNNGGTLSLPSSGVFTPGAVTVSNTSVAGTSSYLGGVLGGNSYASSSIDRVSGSLAVTIDNTSGGAVSYVGGVAGSNSGALGHATGSVSLVDLNSGSLDNATVIGGVVGANYGALTDSSSTGSIRGASQIGGLVGYNGVNGSIARSYSLAAVSSTSAKAGENYLGGLVGLNDGSIDQSLYQGGVTGATTGAGTTNATGGLVGRNNSGGTIQDSYAVGTVTGGMNVGGLVGINDGKVMTSYASASLSSTMDSMGGLFGQNNNTAAVTGSFYDLGQTPNDGSGYGATSVQMQSSATFLGAGWDIASQGGSGIWRIYEGQTMPLLRTFMTGLTITANDAATTYDGSTYSGGNGYTYSLPQVNPDLLPGAATYGGTSQGARSAGSYTLSVSGLYSSQFGYDISTVDGKLTISPRALDVITASAADKVYDGGTSAQVSGGLSGLVSGDTVSLVSSGAFSDKNVGSGKAVSASFGLSGTDSGNYVLNPFAGSLTASITPLTLQLSGSTAASRVYDGTTNAAVTAGSMVNLVSGDTVAVSGSGSFADKNAAYGKSVTASYTLSGADAGNYRIGTEQLYADITPLAITGQVTADNKVYDGTTAATMHGQLTGVLSGDNVQLSASGSFADKNAATGKSVTAAWLVTGADAGNYSVTVPGTITSIITSTGGLSTDGPLVLSTILNQITVQADITPLAITGSITASNKTYDATTMATTSGSLNGVLSGDTVSLATSGSFSDKNVGTGKTVTVSGNLSGTDAGNYTVSTNGTTTADISALAITGNITASNKTYDATTTASTSGSLNGVLSGDTVSLTTSGSFSDKNVGTGKTVTVSGNLSGTDAGNYTVSTNGTTTANISALAITGNITASNKIYDATTAAKTSGSLSGVISGDAVSLATSGSFSDKNVGTGKTVTVSGSLSGTDAGNYTVTSNTSTTADISALAITGNITASNKTYDATTTAKTSGSLSGVISGDTVSLSTSGSFSDKNVGTGKTVTVSGSLSGTDAGNYTVSTNGTTTADISALAITGNITASNKTYDATTAAKTSGSLSGVLSGDTVSLATSGSFSDKNVGTGKTVTVSGNLSGTDAGNYTVSTNGTTTADISALAITGNITASNKIYDATTAVKTSGSLNGVISGDTVSLATSGSFSDKNVGTGKTVTVSGSLSGTDAGNYTVTSNTSTTADISALAITGNITASNKTYDATTAAKTSGSLSGVISGDTVSLTTSGSFSDKNVGTGKTVTVSGSLSGTDAGNYTVSTNGTTTADISALAITGNITASNKTYDATTTATTSGSLSGVISGDTLSLSTSGSFSDKNVGTGKTVTVSGNLSGTDAGNYTVSTNGTTTADISALAITGNITASNKTYDATTTATTSGSLSGVLSGDTVSLTTSGSFSDKNVGTGKTVTVSGSLSGTDAGNYTVSTNGTTTADISALAITGNITASNKTYDATTMASTSGSLSGVISGDTVSLTTSGSFSDKNVGTGKTVTVSGSISGADAGNYTLTTNTTTTANITPYTLNVTGIATQNKVYDGTLSAQVSGGVLHGVLDGDTVRLDSLSGAFIDKHVGTGKTVNILFALSGADAANYLATPAASLTADITPKALTISGSVAADKVYDGAVTANVTVGALAGVIAGDQVSTTATGAFADRHAGSGKSVAVTYVLGGSAGGDYILSGETLTASITPKALSISGSSASDKTYDGATQAVVTAGALSGVISGDEVAVRAIGNFSDKAAGSDKTVNVTYLLGGAEAGDYALAGQSLTASITQAVLVIKANDAVMIDGGVTPAFSSSIDRFMISDNLSGVSGSTLLAVGEGVNVGSLIDGLSGTLHFTTQATNDPSVRSINLSGVSSSNYAVQFQSGVLRILPAPQVAGSGGVSGDVPPPSNPAVFRDLPLPPPPPEPMEGDNGMWLMDQDGIHLPDGITANPGTPDNTSS